MGSLSSMTIEELVRRCASRGDVAAWEEFVHRFHRLIAKVVLRTSLKFGDPSRDTVDDLIQETYLKLCTDNYRLLRNFDHRVPEAFVGFIQVVTANVVRDHFRSAAAKRRGANQIAQVADDFVPAAQADSEGSPEKIERALLLEEVGKHLYECVSPAERERNITIFWLYYRVGLSARAIASLPGSELTTEGVESIVFRLKGELRKRMNAPKSRDRGAVREQPEGVLPKRPL